MRETTVTIIDWSQMWHTVRIRNTKFKKKRLSQRDTWPEAIVGIRSFKF